MQQRRGAKYGERKGNKMDEHWYTAEDYETDLTAITSTAADLAEAHKRFPHVTAKFAADLRACGQLLTTMGNQCLNHATITSQEKDILSSEPGSEGHSSPPEYTAPSHLSPAPSISVIGGLAWLRKLTDKSQMTFMRSGTMAAKSRKRTTNG